MRRSGFTLIELLVVITIIVVLLALLTPAIGAAPRPTVLASNDAMGGAVKHVDAEGAAKLLEDNKGVVVLDIRTPAEFERGHIAGAKNVDFNDVGFKKKVEALDKDKPYLVHCASGGRSTRSLETFKSLGFKSIYHLDGGIKAWEKAGKPVEK